MAFMKLSPYRIGSEIRASLKKRLVMLTCRGAKGYAIFKE
jgi:hypothetical protein